MPHDTSPEIRDAAESDMPAIRDIYTHHVLHGLASWEETPPDIPEMCRRRNAIIADRYPYIVAEMAGRIMGYGYVSKYRPRPAYRHTVENSIYVAADAHRRGIGKALITALIERSTAMGLRRMVAIIGDSGNLPSIALHEWAGFAHVGVIPSCGFKHGQWLDQVIMQRPLGSGDTAPPGN